MQYAYESSVSFHDYARHVRSSQVFGFNVVYPLLLSEGKKAEFIKKLVPVSGEIDHWHFEYQPEFDYLGEWQGPLKPIDYITSVDFAIFLNCSNGERVAILTEVKFTEPGFTPCGGFKSNGNQNKKFCAHSFKFQDVSSNCYLVAKKGRKYFQLLSGIYNGYLGQVALLCTTISLCVIMLLPKPLSLIKLSINATSVWFSTIIMNWSKKNGNHTKTCVLIPKNPCYLESKLASLFLAAKIRLIINILLIDTNWNHQNKLKLNNLGIMTLHSKMVA